MTRTPLSRSKVKGQGHQAALLSAALTRKAAAAVSVGTYSGWGKYCYVASARRRARCLGAHGEGEGRGHIVSPRAQLVYIRNAIFQPGSIVTYIGFCQSVRLKFEIKLH